MKKHSYQNLTELAQRAVVVTAEQTDHAWIRFRLFMQTRAKPARQSFVSWFREAALSLSSCVPNLGVAHGFLDEAADSELGSEAAEFDPCAWAWLELRTLARPVRFAVILHCLNNRSYDVVADRLGVTPAEARRLVRHGLARLRYSLRTAQRRRS
ncbi:MAG: hypothetical protein ABIL25_01930 [candidate division WOR-3 bacterium]